MRMFNFSAYTRFARFIWLLLLGGIMLLIAACAPGGTGAGTATHPSQTATSTPTSTAAFPSNSALTGCPESTQDVHWPQPPAAIVTPRQSTTVNVKAGETFEIAAPMGHKWALLPPVGSILRLDNPAGYGDPTLKTCIWHFTTLSSGQATLEFSMEPLCATGEKCPQYITVVDFTVQVRSS